MALPSLAIFVCLTTGPAQLPKTQADIAGLYVIRTGYEARTLDFTKDGRMQMTTRADHPGGKTWKGEWAFEAGVVVVSMPYHQQNKLKMMTMHLLPLVWGERSMLVDLGELKSGYLVKELKDRFQTLSKTGMLAPVPTKVGKLTDSLGEVSGEMKVARPYQDLLKLKPKSYESSRASARLANSTQ